MAEKIQIEVRFDPKNSERPFGLPRRTEVERGTTIEWIIKDPFVLEEIIFSKRKLRRGFKFTVYFEKTSAFDWKTESLLVAGFPPFMPQPYPIKVASGTAENKGDHKYGLKLESNENDDDSKPDYDDDPIIEVI